MRLAMSADCSSFFLLRRA